VTAPAENGWFTASGHFWIYYNTRKGKKPTNRTKEQELFVKSPWVIMHFKNKESALSKDPDRADWVDIYAQEIRDDSYLSVRTVYVDRPPRSPLSRWRRDSSIRHVRAYLLVKGTIKYR
jgi:hypothetical protein